MDKPIFSGDLIILEVIPPLVLTQFQFTLQTTRNSFLKMNGVSPITEGDTIEFSQLLSYIDSAYVGGQGLLSLEVVSYFTALSTVNKLPNKLKFNFRVTVPAINPTSGTPSPISSYSGDCRIVYKNFPDYLTIN